MAMHNFQISTNRSFLYRKLKVDSAQLIEVNNFTVINYLENIQKEIKYTHNISLSDLSFLQRVGFKGKEMCKWLNDQGISVPPKVNTAICLENQCLVAKVGENELLVLDALQSPTNLPRKLIQTWTQQYELSVESSNYIIPRQDSHSCIAISGEKAADVFSKVCAVDLRPAKFDNYGVAQTIIARVSAMIVRHDLGKVLHYYVLCDSSYTEYLWDCLLDAIEEYQGKVVGIAALRALTK